MNDFSDKTTDGWKAIPKIKKSLKSLSIFVVFSSFVTRYDSGMDRMDRSKPMPVKHWSFAGLMLTYWCNARCASCYLCCGPQRTANGESRSAIEQIESQRTFSIRDSRLATRDSDDMSIDAALELWRGLIQASPHGCRVHLSGGEPFGDCDKLIELCRRAKTEGLGPLEKVETNAFWATDEATVREKVAALDDAGMQKLGISCDPYHQEFVPIERCRLAARVAGEMLGEDRVQVRWRDWLEGGVDVMGMSESQRSAALAEYAASRRERLNGRAADVLARYLPCQPMEAFADNSCHESLLRSRHVHVDGAGRVMPGTCAGILLGTVSESVGIGEIWRRLAEDFSCGRCRPVVGTLARSGPYGLAQAARAAGFQPRAEGYAGKCHLCWDVRRFLALRGEHADELGPAWLYEQPSSEI